MNNLEKLVLRCFQSHEKLVITFDPKITTIVGESDRGKSAIVRALSWVLFNVPGGADFIKHGEESAKARLRINGQWITRERGKENVYRLDEKEFKAFGTQVPNEISELAQVSEINIQRQFDAPFWFSESNGEISRRLNEIVDLGIIDRVLGAAAGKVRSHTSKIDLHEERIKQLEEKKESLKFVKELNIQVHKVQEVQTYIDVKNKKFERLDKFISTIRAQRTLQKENEEFQTIVRSTLQLGDKLKQTNNRIARLVYLHDLAKSNRTKGEFKYPNLEKIRQIIDSLGKQTIRMNRLKELLETFQEERTYLKECKAKAELAHDNVHKQFKELKECPLCHQKL
jgi:exonuclease SbcC